MSDTTVVIADVRSELIRRPSTGENGSNDAEPPPPSPPPPPPSSPRGAPPSSPRPASPARARLRYSAPPLSASTAASAVVVTPRTTITNGNNNNRVIDSAIDLRGRERVAARGEATRGGAGWRARRAEARTPRRVVDHSQRAGGGETWEEGGGGRKAYDTRPAATASPSSVDGELFDFEDYFGAAVKASMEPMQVQESKTAGASSPWLQYHLGQSHGFFGTSHKLNLRKEPAPLIRVPSADIVVSAAARPVLHKSQSNLETRPYSTSAPSRPKLKLSGRNPGGEHGGPITYENMWWIGSKNEKASGLNPMQAPPTTRPWDDVKSATGKRGTHAAILPAVTATGKPASSSTQKPENRMRSAQNRLLGTTRAEHGLPGAKKGAHNNYIDLKYPDTLKLGRLGEISRLGSTLGISVSYRLSGDRDPRLATADGERGGQTGAKRLKHFGVRCRPERENEPSSSFSSSSSATRPRTAPDILERLPPLKGESGESGVDKQVSHPAGDVSGRIDPESVFTPAATAGVASEGYGKEITDGVGLPTSDSGGGSRSLEPLEPSNRRGASGERRERSIESSSATAGGDNKADTGARISPDNGTSGKANLSMSNFFCITVEPNSLSGSGIRVYPGGGGREEAEGEFTSASSSSSSGGADDADRARRVRFSVTNEVHEYQPWEPIEGSAGDGDSSSQTYPTAVPPLSGVLPTGDATLKVHNIDFPV